MVEFLLALLRLLSGFTAGEASRATPCLSRYASFVVAHRRSPGRHQRLPSKFFARLEHNSKFNSAYHPTPIDRFKLASIQPLRPAKQGPHP